MSETGTLASSLGAIRSRIEAACHRGGRKPEEVRLIAVSKTVPAERVREAVALGIRDLGENRVQEATEKAAALGAGPTWHLLGHLQSNKAKKAVELFSWVHSLDSAEIAGEVAKRSAAIGKTIDALIELNLTGESQKTGLDPARLDETVEAIRNLPGLRLRGLMTMAPFTDDLETVRRCFRELRDTLERTRDLHNLGPDFRDLSMGMTGDFEIAIEEGSTMIRIGRALFGDRPAP